MQKNIHYKLNNVTYKSTEKTNIVRQPTVLCGEDPHCKTVTPKKAPNE